VDTKSKVLIAAFFAVVVVATVWKYDAFVIRHDFRVYDQVPCDPITESCFAYECEEFDEECDDAPFKKIEKNAKYIPLCPNYLEEECKPLSCTTGEEDCVETLCSEDVLEEGEMCVTAENVELSSEDVSEESEEQDSEPLESEEE
jgi:hypothetical protein